MRRPQFSLKTLLWLMVVVVVASYEVPRLWPAMPGRFQVMLDALQSMRPSYWLLIGCLVAAVVLTFTLEGRRPRRISEKTWMRLFYAPLLACYGACIAIVSVLLSYFFGIREWLSILLAFPLGLVLLITAAKMSEY